MKSASTVVFYLAGFALWAFEMIWFYAWWGGAGVAVAFFIPPLAALFPFIFLFKEGVSVLYFSVWAVGIAAAWHAGRSTGVTGHN